MWTLWLIPITSFGIAVTIFHQRLIREAQPWIPVAATSPRGAERATSPAAADQEIANDRLVAGAVSLDLDTDRGVAQLTERLRKATSELFLAVGRA